MTNAEKYRDEIMTWDCENDYCSDFVEPKILASLGRKCGVENTTCDLCKAIQFLWFQEEYKEPEVDWTKVEVDTPIIAYFGVFRAKKHFAKYENGKIYFYVNGKTSWTVTNANDYEECDYARLATEEDLK